LTNGRRFRVALVALAALAAACNSGLYRGQDRADDDALLGPPPPESFQCAEASQTLDSNNDKAPDTRVHLLDGKVQCRGEDTDNDRRIDTWSRLDEKGQVVEQATDTNRDGALDRHARDTNGDGTLDLVAPLPAHTAPR